jgi:hypothetical protein
MGRQLASCFAAEFTVVVPELRGYGDSAKPHSGPTMRDIQSVPWPLTKSRRWRRSASSASPSPATTAATAATTAWRDHLERGERVALLDIVPTLYRFETID